MNIETVPSIAIAFLTWVKYIINQLIAIQLHCRQDDMH
jgi:hypothetical protein